MAGFKHEQGIELLEWQGLRLSSGGISAERVRYAQNPEKGLNLAASASGITLRLPSFFARCRLVRCKSTSRLEIRSYPPAGDSEPPATDLEQYERWAAWLPQRLTIADLRISLPCAKGRCDERGR